MDNIFTNHRSPRPASREQPVPLAEVVKTAARDLVDLLAAQIRLARFELAGDVHVAIGRVARIGACVPPILLGYAFLMAAGAAWLARSWGWPLALAAVGLLNGVVGVVGVLTAAATLRKLRPLHLSEADAVKTIDRVVAAASSRTGATDA